VHIAARAPTTRSCKVAIVHDYLNQYGGAERVLDEFKLMYPDAPVYTAIHNPAAMPARYQNWDIRPSWLNRMPMANRRHQMLLPLYPMAFESFDLSGYDLVLTSSSGFAHGVLTQHHTLNVCYCHSPARFLWDYHSYAAQEQLSRPARAFVDSQLLRLRQWDKVSADRTDAWICTSDVVKRRVRKLYGQDSTVIPPPVDTTRFAVGTGDGGYYLMLMRLVPWKRPDIVVDACTRLGVNLIVAGDGRALEGLRKSAGPTVKFVGRVNDSQMRDLYRACKALILPSMEDFGITPLEAMASGRPVIAFGRGGVLDTVMPGVTGEFFDEQSADSVAAALTAFDPARYDPRRIRRHAETYDSVLFRERLQMFIDGSLAART
jgi:glycosyltransferase involved in cell wall biosynthesis